MGQLVLLFSWQFGLTFSQLGLQRRGGALGSRLVHHQFGGRQNRSRFNILQTPLTVGLKVAQRINFRIKQIDPDGIRGIQGIDIQNRPANCKVPRRRHHFLPDVAHLC